MRPTMSSFGIRWAAFALLVLLAGYVVCSESECLSDDNESVLQPGHKYLYRFKSEALAEAVGTTDQRGRIMIECSVEVTHLHDCYFNLLMEDCTYGVAHGPPHAESSLKKSEKIAELSKYSIQFSLVSGAVTNVYRSEKDPMYFVNIKRAALSAFVFNLSERKYEMVTDVHGTCPTKVERVEDGVVKTSKDMLYCAYPSRPDWQLSPWSMFWNMSFIQYVINSTLKCEYKVNFPDKQLDAIFCKERHAIMLESTHQTTTAVQTNIYYRMGLVEVKKLKDKERKGALSSVQTGIVYEYLPTPDLSPTTEPENFLPVAKNMLSELVEISQEEIRLHTIPKFIDFVAWLRMSHNLDSFLQSVTSCTFLEKNVPCSDELKDLSIAYLSDALIQCQTIPCFDAILKLVEQDAFSDLYLNFALYSWGNMHFTKPEIISRVMDICIAKESRFCWLTFGTIIKKFYETTSASSKEKVTEVRYAVNHLANNIGNRCKPAIEFLSKQERNDHMLMYLRAIGNAGEAFIKYKPRGVIPLLKCVIEADLPMFVRTSAVEVMHQMNICSYSISSCHLIHGDLSSVLQDASADPNLRIAVYNLLMDGPDKYSFQSELVSLLKNEKNSQVSSYIASDLINRINDAEYVERFPIFIKELIQYLERDEVVLEDLQKFEEGVSESELHGFFTKLSFLPKELQGFGLKQYLSHIYSYYNRLPQRFRSTFVVQLFNKVIHLFTVGGNIEGWQDFGLVLSQFFEKLDANMYAMNDEEISNYAHKAIQFFTGEESAPPQFKFDPVIIRNIRNIYSNFQRHKHSAIPLIHMYFQMFGTTLSYFTSDDVLGSMHLLVEDFNQFLSKLPEGVIYNSTRVIRVIEAYYQVPTIMGLPLNWTTDATFAFSMRSGLKLNLQEEIQGRGFIQPSAALTFLNRMIVDFPTYAKFGIQANSSGYTSVQFGAEVDFQSDVKSIKFDAPSKPQKILELFRTNQIIKLDTIEDIPPWDYDRTSADWCTRKELSSVLGFQVCHERSYPNVTHLIKPWALMTGWCLWRLELLPYDKKMDSYNFYFMNITSTDQENKFKLKFDTPEGEHKREVLFNVAIDSKIGGIRADIHIPSLPDFSFAVTRVNYFQDSKYIGSSDALSLKLSDPLQYHLSHNYETKTERRKDDSPAEDSIVKSKKVVATTLHRNIKLETPYNIYSYARKTLYQDRTVKVDVLTSYENQNPEWNFIARLLPPTFWENSSKAYVHFLLNYKGLSRKSKDVLTSHLSGEVITPKAKIQLNSNTLMMSGRFQVVANLTKSNSPRENLLSFANFTYDVWNSAVGDNNVKEIKIVNLTIPHRSWGLEVKKVVEDNKQQYSVAFLRAKMVPIDASTDEDDHVGSADVEHHFKLHQVNFRLQADIEDKYPDESQLLASFDNLKESDIKGLRTLYRIADVQFNYPFGSKQENFKFVGKFLLSRASEVFRFQKDFTLFSSYNNLQLTSHTVYRSEKKLRELAHNSYFTHLTSDTQAFYNMDFKQGVNQKGCYHIYFNHNITSHVYNMQSNIIYFCHSEDIKQHTLVLNLDSNSRYWQMLDMKIRQIIKDVSHDLTEESMNFTNPNMFINVNAEWKGRQHRKVAIFNQVGKEQPVMKIIIHSTRLSAYQFEVIFPDGEKETKIFFRTKLSNDHKKLEGYFYFPDVSHQVFHVHGNILNPDHRVWKVDLYPSLSKFTDFVDGVLKNVFMSLKTIADDEYHPLNRMLEPALKMPLSQYLYELGQDIKLVSHHSFENAKEALQSLRPFYESPVWILSNAYGVVSEQWRTLFSSIEKKSIAIWAIKYFEVPQILQDMLKNMPSPVTLFQGWLYGNSKENSLDRPMKSLSFHSTKLIIWKYFHELPSLNLHYVMQLLPDSVFGERQAIPPLHKQERESKLAMILGPRHVYTFDGLLYEFPTYPSEKCIYLLAHDVYSSKFSIVITAEYIHLLFSEATVSINSKDEVYIDNSGSVTPLPYQTSNSSVYVRREGSIVKVTSPFLTVLCEGQSFLCTLELSGWYGGGIIGLLGNADGELYNEFMIPKGDVTTDVIQFARSYELSGNSKCNDLTIAEKSLPLKQHEGQCQRRLQKVCTYYDYLKKSFLDPCLTYLKEENNVCYTEAALAALCYHKQQPIETSCNVPKQEKAQTQHKLQVVLMVNQHHSMVKDKNLRKGIESIVNAVAEQFTSHGYSSVHFSLVGFGGANVRYQPSVHAVGSNIWLLHKETISELLPTLEFDGTQKFNPVVAVKYAAEVLGHDTFDTKVLVIITDKDKLTSNKAVLQQIQNYLDKNHITLYTIASYPTIDKGKKVFGIRADGLIFPSLKKGGDFMDYPRGDLAKLTSGTRGSLFLKKFLDSNEPESYFTEFAQEVWAKVRKEVGYCRSCKSVQSGWWYFQNECHLVNCST